MRKNMDFYSTNTVNFIFWNYLNLIFSSVKLS